MLETYRLEYFKIHFNMLGDAELVLKERREIEQLKRQKIELNELSFWTYYAQGLI